MIKLKTTHPKPYLSWAIKRRAYPLLVLQLIWLYCRSARFRVLVRVSLRHRKRIRIGLLHKLVKGYLLLNHSRLSINGLNKLALRRKAKTFWRF